MLAATHSALPLDAMFHRLFEASPDPTVVAEFGTGRMLMLNPQFERLIGCELQPTRYDLVAAAFNDAVRRAEATSQEKLGKLTAGMPLPPGMKFPF